MSFFVQMAFRNLGRHGKRTLITAVSIAVGLAFYLFLNSALQGVDKASQRNLISYETGSMQIFSPEGAVTRNRFSLRDPLQRSRDLLGVLASQGYRATPRDVFQAELVLSGAFYSNPSSVVVAAAGVDPAGFAKVFSQQDVVLQGRWLRKGEYDVVLGNWLAADLGVKVGDPVTLSARTRQGSFQVLDLTVSGILDSPDPETDRHGVFLPIDVVDSELAMDGNATQIVVSLDPEADIAPEARKLQGLLDQRDFTAKVLTWEDLVPGVSALADAKQKSNDFLVFLVFVIAAVGIGNTLLMAFYERKNEIATLRALGMDDTRLFWTFLLEASGIGVIGSVVGLALGAIFVAFLVYVGVDFGFLIRKVDIGYRIAGTFYGVWDAGSFVTAFVLGVVLPAVTAVLPTRRALCIGIPEGLRVE